MKNAEALQQQFRKLEQIWATPTSEASKARAKSVNRLWAGETLRFIYHDHANNEPVERIMRDAGAVGQQELPLWGMELMSVFVPKKS